MAMAPRAAGRVGHVSHAARAAARLARGMNWLETERRASLMRSRRALGPAHSALIWHVWGGFQRRISRALRSFCQGSGTELLWTVEALCRTLDKSVPRSGS